MSRANFFCKKQTKKLNGTYWLQVTSAISKSIKDQTNPVKI